MGSPQVSSLAHIFKGSFVHASLSSPMDILQGHLLGVEESGKVSPARGESGWRQAAFARARGRLADEHERVGGSEERWSRAGWQEALGRRGRGKEVI